MSEQKQIKKNPNPLVIKGIFFGVLLSTITVKINNYKTLIKRFYTDDIKVLHTSLSHNNISRFISNDII